MCINALIMNEFEKTTLEMEFKAFATKNFERPAKCENLEQVRFYIKELCLKMEEHRKLAAYIPEVAYVLLAQYNARQNSMLYNEFVNSY